MHLFTFASVHALSFYLFNQQNGFYIHLTLMTYCISNNDIFLIYIYISDDQSFACGGALLPAIEIRIMWRLSRRKGIRGRHRCVITLFWQPTDGQAGKAGWTVILGLLGICQRLHWRLSKRHPLIITIKVSPQRHFRRIVATFALKCKCINRHFKPRL